MDDNQNRISPLRWAFAGVMVVLVIWFLSAIGQTDWVPRMVDAARNLPFVGPERVAAAEDMFYTAQDGWTQWIYRYTHSPVVTSDDPALVSEQQGLKTQATGSRPNSPAPVQPLIVSDAQRGEGVWTSTEMPLGNQPHPPLWHTFYRPDPDRPYARADLVRINLSQTQLTLVPGTVEPRPIDGKGGPGQIPPDVQTSGKLLAAWNGGFLTIHGAYGMMVDRRVIAPPRDGFAVLALYADGTVKLGAWGSDIQMTPDLVSFRQNGPILIDHGQVNQNALLSWGKSVSGNIYIWRSGIGLAADGSLIYAMGNELSARTLGETLKRAGAVQAMQLDVNAWHVFFYTYLLTQKDLVATKLVPDFPGSLKIGLIPRDRDLMYLMLKK